MQCNLLLCWFTGLTIDDEDWDHSTFSNNRDRLLEHDVIPELFDELIAPARKKNLLSEDHFSVGGTLIQVWKSQKNFRVNFRPKYKDGSDLCCGGRKKLQELPRQRSQDGFSRPHSNRKSQRLGGKHSGKLG